MAGLQARMTEGDPRLYNVNRDLAHNFDQVILATASRIEAATWKDLHDIARASGVSDEDLGKACQCLCRFILAQSDDKKESMAGCLARCGFLDLHPAARVVVTSYLGTVVLGMHWAGVHEATMGGIGPVLTYQDLRWYGVRCVKLMQMPPWRRTLYKLRARWRRAWRNFWKPDAFTRDSARRPVAPPPGSTSHAKKEKPPEPRRQRIGGSGDQHDPDTFRLDSSQPPS